MEESKTKAIEDATTTGKDGTKKFSGNGGLLLKIYYWNLGHFFGATFCKIDEVKG